MTEVQHMECWMEGTRRKNGGFDRCIIIQVFGNGCRD